MRSSIFLLIILLASEMKAQVPLPPCDVSLASTPITCAGDDNGTLTVVENSGGPYTFIWGHDPNITTGSATALPPELVVELTDEATGRTGYIQRGGYSAGEPDTSARWPSSMTEAMTAVALSCRYAMWPNEPDPEVVAKGFSRLLDLPPSNAEGRIDYFYWYFGTRALRASELPGLAKWDYALRSAVVERQAASGSFEPLVDP